MCGVTVLPDARIRYICFNLDSLTMMEAKSVRYIANPEDYQNTCIAGPEPLEDTWIH